ncbi:MAG: Lamin tail domain-containing protein [Cenarchaeum symbiont of Oopsacas minuta]|nr:Lamin tail domain-containing protein [Cenarchaeum symbiont of Oopsacas minuta]
MTCSAGYANAQGFDLADNIVINEVEIGDQSKNDWIELYNPTRDSINIGGWTISSFVLGEVTFTIPENTVLDPGMFLVYEYDENWFSHKSSLVQIRDTYGDIIDHTTLIDDIYDDSQTWSRIIDGYKDPRYNEWQFGPSTMGELNSLDSPYTSSIEISTDSEMYYFGDSVRIFGTVSEILTESTQQSIPSPFILEIIGPEKTRTITLYPDRNLNISHMLTLQPRVDYGAGVYTIDASYGQLNDSTKFTLVGDHVKVETVTESKFIQISSDAPMYNPGQTVTLSGSTNAYMQYESMSYSVMDPNGELYRSGTLFPKTDGTFTTEFRLVPLITIAGEYSTTFEYVDHVANITFDVISAEISENPIDIFFDKNVYELGDTVRINGSINDVVDTTIEILIQQISSTPESITGLLDKKSDSIRTVNSKEFSYEYVIHQDPDRFGEYKVTFTNKNYDEERIFVVDSNPDMYEQDALPLTIMSDRQTYNVGDPITFSGQVNVEKGQIMQGQVKITMTDLGVENLTTAAAKAGKDKVTTTVEYVLTKVPDKIGNYTVKGNLFRSLFTFGTYEATANYADGLYTKSITFQVIDPIQQGAPFVLHIEKDNFGANESVLVTADAPGLTHGNPVTISLHKPNGDVENFTINSDESSFDWSWRIPAILDKDDQGSYRAVFSNKLGSDEVEFMVIGKMEQQDPITMTVTIGGDLVSNGNAEINGIIPKEKIGSKPISIRVYSTSDLEQILYMANVKIDEQNRFTSNIPLIAEYWGTGSYEVIISNGDEFVTAVFTLKEAMVEQIRHTEKFANIRETYLTMPITTIDLDGHTAHPRIIQGTLIAGSYGTGQSANMSLISPSGTCVIGLENSCLIQDMTIITTDGPYKTIEIDGTSYKVRYSGTDANIERFTILPAAQGQVFNDSEWIIDVKDDNLPTKIHYKITYVG